MGVMEMKDLILLCTMAVFFLGGYFVMKRVDTFLGRNLRMPEEQEAQPAPDEKEEKHPHK